MEKYLPVMSGDYKKKHYADGVFASIRKKTAKISFSGSCFWAAHTAHTGRTEGSSSTVWRGRMT